MRIFACRIQRILFSSLSLSHVCSQVRLAWHSCGSYSKADGSGGSSGCLMRFSPEAGWGANAGLATARNFLGPLAQQFPGLSNADLYTYAGAVAVEHMGGHAIPFKFGRTDATDGVCFRYYINHCASSSFSILSCPSSITSIY
jgi:hypothetical protein